MTMAPNPKIHHVVALDAWVKPPAFEFDHDVYIIQNIQTNMEPEALKKATMIMTSGTPVTKEIIDAAENVGLVAVNGTGTDHVDKKSLRERNILLCHVPAQNTDSVSEHAFAMYYALRRRIIPMHQAVMDGESWPTKRGGHLLFGKQTRTNEEETLVEKIGKALGMRVVIAERKGGNEVRPGRTAFDEALKAGTLFIIVAPLNDETRDMIGDKELASIDPTSIIVNVGRGGIIEEAALVKALRDDRLAGAATDVFEHEPVDKSTSLLLDPTIPNLILSPHIAWYSTRTVNGTLTTIKANLEAYAAGKPQNLVEL